MMVSYDPMGMGIRDGADGGALRSRARTTAVRGGCRKKRRIEDGGRTRMDPDIGEEVGTIKTIDLAEP